MVGVSQVLMMKCKLTERKNVLEECRYLCHDLRCDRHFRISRDGDDISLAWKEKLCETVGEGVICVGNRSFSRRRVLPQINSILFNEDSVRIMGELLPKTHIYPAAHT